MDLSRSPLKYCLLREYLLVTDLGGELTQPVSPVEHCDQSIGGTHPLTHTGKFLLRLILEPQTLAFSVLLQHKGTNVPFVHMYADTRKRSG